jgi:hypothetical protein
MPTATFATADTRLMTPPRSPGSSGSTSRPSPAGPTTGRLTSIRTLGGHRGFRADEILTDLAETRIDRQPTHV